VLRAAYAGYVVDRLRKSVGQNVTASIASLLTELNLAAGFGC
jgi:hypothetical protein